MGLLSPLVSRSSAAPSAVFATHLSRGWGLLSAFAGTKPTLTAKYPTPASTTSVKIMPPRKLTIDFIVLDVRYHKDHRIGRTQENDKMAQSPQLATRSSLWTFSSKRRRNPKSSAMS